MLNMAGSPRAWRKRRPWARSVARAAVRFGWAGPAATAVLVLPAACGSTAHRSAAPTPPPELLAEARPIGRGVRFQPPAVGPVVGPCGRGLGRREGVHVELFAANRVVLVAAGIGTRPPRRLSEGRISSAACYGELVTLDPTGLVLVRPGSRPVLADLFRAWGQPLSSRRLASFSASAHDSVAVFVDGRRWGGAPEEVPLRPHAEIVLEVGPYVPPHRAYAFPPGT
jgi:hypothetical protein